MQDELVDVSEMHRTLKKLVRVRDAAYAVAIATVLVAAATYFRPQPAVAPPAALPRYEWRVLEGGLYRFDRTEGTFCYVQNVSSKLPLLGASRWSSGYEKQKDDAGRERWAKYTGMALEDDCPRWERP